MRVLVGSYSSRGTKSNRYWVPVDWVVETRGGKFGSCPTDPGSQNISHRVTPASFPQLPTQILHIARSTFIAGPSPRPSMDTTGDEVQDTLSLIEGTGLPHPSGPLLASFITEAVNPVAAASYVKERLLVDQGLSLVANWTYIIESSKCASLSFLLSSIFSFCLSSNYHKSKMVRPRHRQMLLHGS